MKVQIAKWGNSAAVRLPKAVLDRLGLAPGTELDIVVEGSSLRLSPAAKRPVLTELLAEMERLGGRNYDYGQSEWPVEADDWPEVGPDPEPGR